MAAQIIVDVSVVAELDTTYTVTWSATGSTEMPTEVFVHKYATEEFDHVANAGDLTYPTVKTQGQAWWRQATASANYPDIASADAGKVQVETDLQFLVDEHDAGLVLLLTPETITLDPTP